MNKMIVVGLSSLFFLSACGTTSVSPLIKDKKGVEYGLTHDGYPTIDKVTFNISRSDIEKASYCIMANVNSPESNEVHVRGKVLTISANGTTLISGFSRAFRYTLNANVESGDYTYSRLRYTDSAGLSVNKIMASKYWSPESTYEDLKTTTEDIDECLKL